MTERGTYRFNLGPGDDKVYHEIVAIGMSSVTTEFTKYDLTEICKEYKNDAIGEESKTVHPETMGGSKVHLLLGIKNTKLHPKLVKILPSGVGVFLSPFKDKWGSRMIFAGPHKTFTTGNNGLKTEISHAVFSTHHEIDKEDGLCEKIQSSIPMHKTKSLNISPKGYRVVGMFRDQSPPTNSIEIMYKDSYNKTTENGPSSLQPLRFML